MATPASSAPEALQLVEGGHGPQSLARGGRRTSARDERLVDALRYLGRRLISAAGSTERLRVVASVRLVHHAERGDGHGLLQETYQSPYICCAIATSSQGCLDQRVAAVNLTVDLAIGPAHVPRVGQRIAMSSRSDLPPMPQHVRSLRAGLSCDAFKMRAQPDRRDHRGLSYVNAPFGVRFGRNVDGDTRQVVLLLPSHSSVPQPVARQDQAVAAVDIEALLIKPAAWPPSPAVLPRGKPVGAGKNEGFHPNGNSAERQLLGGKALDRGVVAHERIPGLHCGSGHLQVSAPTSAEEAGEDHSQV
ncbi:hypothetical protein GA0070611_5649 [Micromonospora auratinigra]|uniref:Uncharacterized protein n=1 Tax=Micromonospora auratinigra TaxID=261654 RepID=A0A1A9A8N6_9ACTN|nr:hypothetical protein GA0070611_5649 [Micromonospora auratinigra]